MGSVVNSQWEFRGLEDAYTEAVERKMVRIPLGTRFIHWGYKHFGKPFVFRMPPDKAHSWMIDRCSALSRVSPFMSLLHDITDDSSELLQTRVMGVEYGSPFGLAAGLDKDADLIRILDAAGFGFCSFGSMTDRPCDGNPRPWFKRFPEYVSMGIHAGIPNKGAESVLASADNVEAEYGAVKHASVAFTNTVYPDGVDGMIEDFARGVQSVMNSHVDVCEVNVSCPNLAAGKPFKDAGALDALFSRLDTIQSQVNGVNTKSRKPVLVKMPNATPVELKGLIDVLSEHDVQGLALCNLLEDKTGYPDAASWAGGLSGVPCAERALAAVRFARGEYGNRFALEGVGGVMNPLDAVRMLDAGADLVGFVSTLMFNGPQMASEFKAALNGALLVRNDEFWEATGLQG